LLDKNKNLSNEHVTVFAGLNQVSASLNRFKPHAWQKKVFACRNPTLIILVQKETAVLRT